MGETTQTNQKPQNDPRRILAEEASMVFRASHQAIWDLVAEPLSQMCHDLFVVGYIAGATSVTIRMPEEPSRTPQHADN